jgi:cysteinyl-tRNA synthetase
MRLYNTLKRHKEAFTPANDKDVNMYVCGITAYDLCHIGHARSSVVFDVLYRYLKHEGYNVNFIRNFTDIDDKIIKRAAEVGKEASEIAEKFIGEFYVDMDRLNIQRPTVEPKCTEHIPEMIDLTQRLIDKGHAYATPSGDVYFKVRSFDGYGKLSGRNIDELESGARIAPGEEKQDPLDFALWKAAKPGEPFWESPWGQGRPGWHLECSAMSEKYSSLPLGNFFTIRDILDKFLPETLRYFLLTMHYRSPLDFSFDALEEAEKGVKRIYSALNQIDVELAKEKWKKSPFPEELTTELDEIEKHFTETMADDLNTAGALGHIFSAIRLAGRVAEDKNLRKSEGGRDLFARIKADMADWAKILGIFEREPAEFLLELRDNRAARADIDPAKVQELLDARAQARKDKDFEKSDAIRDELAAMQVEVHDTPQGATWDVL